MPRPLRYMPYMFLRTNEKSLVQHTGYGPQLNYAQFIIRHTSRLEAPKMDPWTYNCFLRYAFLVPSNSQDEEQIRAIGDVVSKRLNEVESARESAQWSNHAASIIVGGISGEDQILDACPSLPVQLARVIQICPDGFQTHNYHKDVWEEIRHSPIRFMPIPRADIKRLNHWLFGLYKHSRDRGMLLAELEKPDSSWTHAHTLVASGALAALRNTELLFASSSDIIR